MMRRNGGIFGTCPAVALALPLALALGCAAQPQPPAPSGPVVTDVDFESLTVADFVEPDFPFITTTVVADDLGPGFPESNVTPRCLALRLGPEAHACFDTDLLRWSVAWTGEFLPMVTMAQISYGDYFNKNNQLPRILGEPVIATGHYPGWSGTTPQFFDPRSPARSPLDPPSGPIAAELGRWDGVYLSDDGAVLAYSVRGTAVREVPGARTAGGQTAFTRTIRIEQLEAPLSMVLAEVTDGTRSEIVNGVARVYHGEDEGSVTAAGLAGEASGVTVEIVEDRYFTLRLEPAEQPVEFTVVLWKGEPAGLPEFDQLRAEPGTVPAYETGGAARWPEVLGTVGQISPDTAAFVLDVLTLPLPNPWDRNVRVVDIDFFSDARRAAVVTFEGDVWILDWIDESLANLRWRRYASGLYEPLSVSVVRDTVYVFGKEGIVRFHDLNGDGEADFYENFSNVMAQSIESREWAADMEPAPGGGFYVAKGGALDLGPRGFSPAMATGFRPGSHHSGVILRVSPDGRSVETIATGLRGPYMGVHPETGEITTSDQQGNFVPSTPLFLVSEGDFFGVPATAHQEPVPEPTPPAAWIPHNVDPSAMSQIWVTSDAMGPLNGGLLHLSYGRPGAMRILLDSTSAGVQAAISVMPIDFPAPAIKGAVNPLDGNVYIAGFALWGTRSSGYSALTRLRYTGLPSAQPEAFQARQEGIVIRFGAEIDAAAAADPARYDIRRWNYRRSGEYGSGHYTLDGTPGEEQMVATSAHVAADGRTVLLAVPGMREVEQMQVAYDLLAADGSAVVDTLYLTVHHLDGVDPVALGFDGLDVSSLQLAGGAVSPAAGAEDVPASAARGEALVQTAGCTGCHSLDGRTDGMIGPTFQGLFGSARQFGDGSSTVANAAYIRESILRPGARVVAGYEIGMPTFEGFFTNNDIESIVQYLESLP